MTEIYLDVLIGLNLYITYALFNCCELLSHVRAKKYRKGLASLIGGLSAMLILWPELGLVSLTVIKLTLAAVLVLVAFGFGDIRRFSRNVLLFFLVNFLFAGVMIACWLIFTPPGMAIRNGVVYFHLSALTLILSTIAASLAVRGLSALFWRRRPEKLIQTARVTVDGKETEIRVLLDTGNRLSCGGTPVITCAKQPLSALLPPEVLAAAEDLSTLSALSGSKWSARVRAVPCETAAGSALLPAFRPDSLTRADGVEVQCLVALVDASFCGGEADAVAPPELWQDV